MTNSNPDSNPVDDLIDSTLDDYLVNLAQGIQQAQRQLNQLTVSGQPGQPMVAYHMPRVEFELKMTFSLLGGTPAARGGGASASATAGAPRAPTKGRLVWQPARPGGTAGSVSGEATSTIRGSFVAVPVAAGRPPPLVNCTLTRKDPRQVLISARVTDALGVPQSDVEVQFNVDRDRSAELSTPGVLSPRTAPVSKWALQPDTDLTLGVVRTGADGKAESLLRIASSEPVGMVVVVSVDALTATETVLVKVE